MPSGDDFTANGLRATRTTPVFHDGELHMETVTHSWYDADVNALSIIEDVHFPDFLNPLDLQSTLYLQLTPERSSVRGLRYTHSDDGDQESVVDCEF